MTILWQIVPVYPIEQLSSEDFINLKEEQDYEITKFLEHLQQKPNIRYEVSNDYAILSMVECGLGISVVHQLMLHPQPIPYPLKTISHPSGKGHCHCGEKRHDPFHHYTTLCRPCRYSGQNHWSNNLPFWIPPLS